MQKIVNAIAIASGAVSLAVVGLGGYVFIRKDAIIDNIKNSLFWTPWNWVRQEWVVKRLDGRLRFLQECR